MKLPDVQPALIDAWFVVANQEQDAVVASFEKMMGAWRLQTPEIQDIIRAWAEASQPGDILTLDDENTGELLAMTIRVTDHRSRLKVGKPEMRSLN